LKSHWDDQVAITLDLENRKVGENGEKSRNLRFDLLYLHYPTIEQQRNDSNNNQNESGNEEKC
jgi:hypothetical protein